MQRIPGVCPIFPRIAAPFNKNLKIREPSVLGNISPEEHNMLVIK